MTPETKTRQSTPPNLWQNRDFFKLWLAQTVSKFGSHITYAANAATAVILLHATPLQMGVLGAIQGGAMLAFGLIAGVWVDRLRRRPLMIAMDIGRAVALVSLPIAWMVGKLSMGQMYVVAGLVGIMNVFFSVADGSALPSLISREELVEANSKLSASESVAEIGGQALGGTLVQLITAPLTIFVDAVSYLFSAACLALIRKPEPLPEPQEVPNVQAEIIEGLHTVVRSPILRTLAANAAIMYFFGSFIGALYWIYLVRDLHLAPAFVGVWVGVGGIGSLVGAFVAGPITRRFGLGLALVGASLYASLVGIYIPLVHGSFLVIAPILLAGQLLSDIAWPVMAVNATSLRQSVISHRLLGRANASMDFLAQGIAPIGALVGGALGGILGIRMTLWIAWAGILISNLPLLFSSIRTMRLPPVQIEATDIEEQKFLVSWDNNTVMTNLELLRSVFVTDWTMLREGWLSSFGSVARLVSSEEIVAYALEVLGSADGEPSPGVTELAFADPNDWEMLTLWMSELASSDPEAIDVARRKWRVVLLKEQLSHLRDDPLDGLLELGDFWLDMGNPEDSPHIVQSVGNTLTPQEYYTAETFQEILARHHRWLDIEIAALGGMDSDLTER